MCSTATGLAPETTGGTSVLTCAAAHIANHSDIAAIWCFFILQSSIENRNHLSDPAPVRDDRRWPAPEPLEPPRSDAWPKTAATCRYAVDPPIGMSRPHPAARTSLQFRPLRRKGIVRMRSVMRSGLV